MDKNAFVLRPTAPIGAQEVASHLRTPLSGPQMEVTCVTSLAAAQPGALVYVRPEYVKTSGLPRFEAGILYLVPTEIEPSDANVTWISVQNPRLAFAQVLTEFFVGKSVAGIHPSAAVHHTAKIDKTSWIGPYSVIGPQASIGARTVVRAHVVIGDRVRIGDDCLVRSHAVIGEEGYGFENDHDGRPFRIPHVGSVVIGNRVEVGALTSIARGTLDDTRIGDDVKIDDHCFIAHNVQIDEGAMVVAGAEVSGSVHVGRRAWIAPQACIRNKVSVGEGAVVGLGAVVIRNVPAGETVIGNPARPMVRGAASR